MQNRGFVFSHREFMNSDFWKLVKIENLKIDFDLQIPDTQD